jgi:hypothetical protein
MKYHFGDHWQVRLLIWNMPANSNGDFNMQRISMKFVPQVLTYEQKHWRVCLPGSVG